MDVRSRTQPHSGIAGRGHLCGSGGGLRGGTGAGRASAQPKLLQAAVQVVCSCWHFLVAGCYNTRICLYRTNTWWDTACQLRYKSAVPSLWWPYSPAVKIRMPLTVASKIINEENFVEGRSKLLTCSTACSRGKMGRCWCWPERNRCLQVRVSITRGAK
jgi:hypothetical protein